MQPDITWEERWLGPDKGLIACWEVGRSMRELKQEIAARAQAGELPVLPWKGGIEGQPKFKKKIGSLNYLAAWRGLRDEDLDIGLTEEHTLTCSRTGVQVIFTGDLEKLAIA